MLSYGEKGFGGAPFGTQAKRFDVSGVHPQTKLIGTFTEIPYNKKANEDLVQKLGPAKYVVDAGDLKHCASHGCAGQGWRKLRDVNMPHILYREAWSNKQKLAESLGPGKYDLKTFIDVLNKKPCSVRGVCNSREERFKDYRKMCAAGPGSYGKGGVPAALLEERSMKSTGTVCPMDFSAGVERFREEPVDCGLYPGTYTIKSCIEQVLDHHVGKRGPFDIFSGRRDKPINCGYLAAPRTACVNPSHYLPPMFGEDLKTAQKRFHGVFSQEQRFPPVPTERIYRHTLAQRPEAVDKPGPGHYSITELTRVENRHPPPFLSSSHRFSKRIGKQPQGVCCNVGPGRYGSPKTLKIYKRDSAAFKSQTPRYLANMDQDTFGQEKLRPCNIPDIWRPYNRHADEALKCPL